MKPPLTVLGWRRIGAVICLMLAATLTGWVPAAAAGEAAGIEITGRVVLADTGAPLAWRHLFPTAVVAAYAPGDLGNQVAWANVADDGTFRLQSSTAAPGSYYLLVLPSAGSAVLPTWYGGERATLSETYNQLRYDMPRPPTDVAPPPASTPTVDVSAGSAAVGDVTVDLGALVVWDSKDGAGNDVRMQFTALSAATRQRVAFYQGGRGTEPVLEPGIQTIEFVASASKPSGRQTLTLDLPKGYSTLPVSWPTEFMSIGGVSVSYPGRGRGGLPASGQRLDGQLNVSQIDEDEPADKMRYQWYRGSERIRGATRSSYVVRAVDRGRKLHLRVRVSKPGYRSETYRSERMRVAKARARLKVTSKPARVSPGSAAQTRMSVRVRLSSGARPSGTIQLYVGTTRQSFIGKIPDEVQVATVPLRKRDRGRLRLSLPAGPDWTTLAGSYHYLYVRFVPSERRDANIVGSRGISLDRP